MYENLKMREILVKLDGATAFQLRDRWPEINYVNYTAKEIFRRLDVKTLSHLYEIGLTSNFAALTALSAEALIRYDADYQCSNYRKGIDSSVTKDIIVKKLQKAFDGHQIFQGSNLVSTLGFILFGNCYEYDYLLAKYGHELSRGLIFMGPEDWFKETLKNSKRAPYIARNIPWANALLEA